MTFSLGRIEHRELMSAKLQEENGIHSASQGSGDVIARDVFTGRTIRLKWEQGMLAGFEPAGERDARDLWVAPALIDLQVNGYGGIDFQRDSLGLEELLSAVRQLRLSGCCRFFLTLITTEWEVLLKRLAHLRCLRSQSLELERAVVGWHVEGPFLSAEPGYHGAHRRDRMLDPTPSRISELRKAAGEDRVILTLAPERPGGVEAVALADSLGMRVCVGHSNAPSEVLRRAREMGAVGFTHLSNGCPSELNRHDNILWRVLEMEDWMITVIPDQIHVSPALFRLLHRLVRREDLVYVTDAMSAAGAPPGTYGLGDLELEVGPDQVVRRPGSTQFAGSALRPIEAPPRAAGMLRCHWRQTWGSMTQTPCRLAGLPDPWTPGQPANFILLSVDAQNQIQEWRTFCEGAGGESSSVTLTS